MRFSFLLLFILLSSAVMADPMGAVGRMEGDTPRTEQMAEIFRSSVEKFFEQSHIAVVKGDQLARELNRFSCTDEKCMLNFAEAAGIGLFAAGSITDRGNYCLLKVSAFGTGFLSGGKELYRYAVKIPAGKKAAGGDLVSAMEEHACRFTAGALDNFSYPQKFSDAEDPEDPDDGIYSVYRNKVPAGPLNEFYEAGKAEVREGVIRQTGGFIPEKDDFIILDKKKESRALRQRLETRKETVFMPVTNGDLLFSCLFIPAGSAVMPVVSPLRGYIPSGDWQGLGLWAVNVLPYTYIEISGFLNRPSEFRKHGRDVSRRTRTDYRFAWYMLLSGGGAAFVDSFAHNYLLNASMYRGRVPYMGSGKTAALLSVITPGGGHFYRGNRLAGYMYFHADSLLLYSVIRSFSPPVSCDGSRRKKGRVQRTRGYALAGLLCAVKITELVHAVLSPDRIVNGEIMEDRGLSFSPAVSSDGHERFFCAEVSCRF